MPDPTVGKALEAAHQLKTAQTIAKVFGASAKQESEGWISIVEDGEVICYLSSDMNIVASPYFRLPTRKTGEKCNNGEPLNMDRAWKAFERAVAKAVGGTS